MFSFIKVCFWCGLCLNSEVSSFCFAVISPKTRSLKILDKLGHGKFYFSQTYLYRGQTFELILVASTFHKNLSVIVHQIMDTNKDAMGGVVY